MSARSAAISARPVLAPARESIGAPPNAGRPLVRVTAFAALSLLGALRWGTLLHPVPTGRVLGLVAVAVTLALVGPWLAARSRILAVVAALAAFVAMLAISGLPLSWLRHARLAVSAAAIGDGLTALPRLLLPYRGLNEWVRMVMLMGAGVLLLDAAVMMAFAMGPASDVPPSPARRASAGPIDAPSADGAGGDLRRAIAGLPLIALAAVPLTLVPAREPYAQGLLMFLLVAALVWGERLPAARGASAAVACAAAAAAAMTLAPRIDAHKPWINYQALASGLTARQAERFDWSQGYGRLTWPQTGRTVLEVQADRGAYWKAVALDVVDAGGWSEGTASNGPWWTGVSAASRRRWTETLVVTIGAMKTTQIIGAGEFNAPTRAGADVTPGAASGTWQTSRSLGNGDAYRVRAYVPNPSAAQLARAGSRYPASVALSELAVTLPPSVANGPQTAVFFAPFGVDRAPSASTLEESGTAALATSPYARAYALARRLRLGAASPYAYVKRVQAYLSHGYRYDLKPPASRYPLATFLFDSHRGYCQQFAGAMALLLRMGGVPARVAAGFTSGQPDASTHRWLVSDFDAHAWVEAFFPGYGWITFDPTPAADPALARTVRTSLLAVAGGSDAQTGNQALGHRQNAPTAALTAPSARRSGGVPAALVAAIAVGAVVAALAALWLVPRGPSSPEQLLTELERAFARSGRPLAPHITLSELERRLQGVSEAQSYVRALGRVRFAGGGPAPTKAGRRAVRAHLRSGLGFAGALRVLWVLPPRRWRQFSQPAEEPDGSRA